MIGAVLTVAIFVVAVCYEVKSIRRQRHLNDVIGNINARATAMRKRHTPGAMPTQELRTMGSGKQ